LTNIRFFIWRRARASCAFFSWAFRRSASFFLASAAWAAAVAAARAGFVGRSLGRGPTSPPLLAEEKSGLAG